MVAKESRHISDMPFTPETAHTGTQFQPGQSGNPKGKPKGTKHITTWIQELVEDPKFEAQIQQGYKIVEYKGAPIKAIIQAQMIKALNGDSKAFDSLAKYGWSQKVENTNEDTIIHKYEDMDDEQLEAALKARENRISGTA